MDYSYIWMGMGYMLWDMDYSYCWYIGMGYGIQAMDYSYIGMCMGYRLWVMDCMYYWYVDMGYGLQLYRDGWGVSYRYGLYV